MEAVDDSESILPHPITIVHLQKHDGNNRLKCLTVSKDENIRQLEKHVMQLKLTIAEKLIEACKSGITTTIAVAPGCPSPASRLQRRHRYPMQIR